MLFSKHEQEEQTMFDQQRIGANIMKARKAKGLTQMALADGLNVSFQAVSNWERGQTCPDLSNLMELSRLLDISIDELLGNEREQEPAAAREPEVELPEAEPEARSQTMAELASCAPYLSTAAVDRLALQHLERGCTLWELSAVAPFLSREALGRLALASRNLGSTLFDLSAIAPFLDSAVLGELVQRELKQGKRLGSGELAALLPFLDSEFIETYLEGQV